MPSGWDLYIYSNDGQTTYYSSSGNGPAETLSVTSTGANRIRSGTTTTIYTYDMPGTFVGFSSVPNANHIEYYPGQTYPLSSGSYALYEVVPTTYRYTTYGGEEVQVESAIRDMNGWRIDTKYTVYAQVPLSIIGSQQYNINFSDLHLGSYTLGSETIQRIPRIIEIYDSSGNLIQTDVKVDTANSKIVIYPIGVSTDTWTVRITAW